MVSYEFYVFHLHRLLVRALVRLVMELLTIAVMWAEVLLCISQLSSSLPLPPPIERPGGGPQASAHTRAREGCGKLCKLDDTIHSSPFQSITPSTLSSSLHLLYPN